MIYFVSDLHFGHKNIMKYEPEYRGYSGVKDMNEHLIKQWNSKITNDDIVYNLGDFFYHTKPTEVEEILSRLQYKKMILIVGNHDDNKTLNILRSKGVEVKYADIIRREGYGLYLSHYPTIIGSKKMYNIHGHLHSKQIGSNYHINVGYDSLGKVAISLEELMEEVIKLSSKDNKGFILGS